MEAPGTNCWLGVFGSTTNKQFNEVYSTILHVPFMTNGRLCLLIATVEGTTNIDKWGQCLMKQVGGFSTLDQSQNSMVRTLLSQKESLSKRALE